MEGCRTDRSATRPCPPTCASTTCTSSAASTSPTSCVNASPQHLFDRLLAGGHGKRTGIDWYEEVAPARARRALRDRAARRSTCRCPNAVGDLTVEQRRELGHSYERGSAWPGDGDRCYAALVEQVATESARRWQAAIGPHANRCCGGCSASAARPTSCSARRRRGSCGCASRRRGTGGSASSSASSRSNRAPVASRWSRGRRSCGDRSNGADTTVARLRGDPLESRPIRRAARGEGAPRDTARRGAGLLRSRVRPRPAALPTAAHAVTNAGSDASTRARNSSSRSGSPSSIQWSSASNTNDTSVSAAQRVRTRAGARRVDHELFGERDHLLAELFGVVLRIAAHARRVAAAGTLRRGSPARR